jgi:general secretion pathway protein E
MERIARSAAPSIRADGRRKVLEGVTTMDEILRVTLSD